VIASSWLFGVTVVPQGLSEWLLSWELWLSTFDATRAWLAASRPFLPDKHMIPVPDCLEQSDQTSICSTAIGNWSNFSYVLVRRRHRITSFFLLKGGKRGKLYLTDKTNIYHLNLDAVQNMCNRNTQA
jgi:hypothetical protein